jgi:hypothetical protein
MVSAIDAKVELSHPERQHVRTLKRVAEATLRDAFRTAQDLAFLAEDVQRTAREMEKGSQ